MSDISVKSCDRSDQKSFKMPATLSTLRRFLQEEEERLALMMMAYQIIKKKKRRTHRFWVNPLILRTHRFGIFDILMEDWEGNEEKFKQFFRLSKAQFNEVLLLVEEDLQKHCLSREPVSPKKRLAICLR